MNREIISKRVRFEVFKRDGFVCQYCGRRPPDVLLEIDHITPVCDNGSSEIENLIASCFDCNRGKAGVPLTSIPVSLEDRATEIREREDQITAYREVVQERLDRIELDIWTVANALFADASTKGMRRDWLLSVKRFLERLPLDEVIDAAEIAASTKPYSENQRFRYFCGVCWRKIKRNSGEEE